MTEPPDILRRIVKARRDRLASHDESPTVTAVPAGRLLAALRREHSGHRVIAEVKLGSPRLGSLVGRIDPEAQAEAYARAGAAALSVVVEPQFFHGSYDLLARCRRASGLPALAKDFVVDVRQLEWARRAGADAILLIAALYRPERLAELGDAASELGLAALVEVHEPEDLLVLGDRRWEMVGVNNRDLRSFEVDLDRSASIVPALPAGAVKVAESGLSRPAQLRRLEAAGFDAFLIGESLLLAPRPQELLASLVGGAE